MLRGILPAFFFATLPLYAEQAWKEVFGVAWLQDLAFGNGTFVATGADARFASVVLISSDGQKWTEAPAPWAGWHDSAAVKFTHDLFFVAPEGSSAEGPHFLCSQDAIVWTAARYSGTFRPYSIAWGGDTYVATGETWDGRAAMGVSTNGFDWEIHGSFLSDLYLQEVAFLSPTPDVPGSWGAFLAGVSIPLAKPGALVSSMDPTRWRVSQRSPYPDRADDGDLFPVRRLVAGPGGTCIAAGYNLSSESPRGLPEWMAAVQLTGNLDGGPPHTLLTHTRFFGKVPMLTFGNNLFVVVADGVLYLSVDGLEWEERVSLPTVSGAACRIAAGNGAFVLAVDGRIYRLPHDGLPRLAALEPRYVKPSEDTDYRWAAGLRVAGVTGHVLRLESSEDLAHWHPITNTISGRIDCTDLTPDSMHRFYRAVDSN